MAINLFQPGEVLDTFRLNDFVNKVNNIESNLADKDLQEEITLWQGDMYLDGGSNYALWSTALHRPWSYVRIYVAYDAQSINGTNGHAFEINCGPNYSYNQDSTSYSTLCCTYSDTYRRICVRTNGLSVSSGSGAGWYLTKVVGVVKQRFNVEE